LKRPQRLRIVPGFAMSLRQVEEEARITRDLIRARISRDRLIQSAEVVSAPCSFRQLDRCRLRGLRSSAVLGNCSKEKDVCHQNK
jgi:hypothetical protein